jgi:hypothetical protein
MRNENMNELQNQQSYQTSVSSCLLLVNSLRKTDRYIENIFMQGGCYQFHLFLKNIFPDAIPFIHKDKDHIVSKIGNNLFDITGIIEIENEYSPLKKSEFEMVEKWSFSRNKMIQISECSFCEEPIVV